MVLNAVKRIKGRLGYETGLLKTVVVTAAEDSKHPPGWETRLVTFRMSTGINQPTRSERTTALANLGEIIRNECSGDYYHHLFETAPSKGLVLAKYLISKQKQE